MLKKSITYKNFNGEEETEVFYFHIGQAALIEMQFSHPEGMGEYMQQVMEEGDRGKIYHVIKQFVDSSIGIKSPDGKRFITNDMARENFMSTPAYDALIMELCTNEEKAAEFINGVVPQGLVEEVQSLTKAQEVQRNVEARQARTGHSQSHPPDEVAQPQTPLPEADPTAIEPGRNVFENNSSEPRVLTQEEFSEMDSDELKSGLATGKYKLQ